MKKLEIKQLEAVQGGDIPWGYVICAVWYILGTDSSNNEFQASWYLDRYTTFCIN